MADFPTPMLNIPVPPSKRGKIRTFDQLKEIESNWSNLVGLEWEQRRKLPNFTIYPGRPQISDSKAFMQFINPPTNPLLSKIYNMSPLVSCSGEDQMARDRKKRIINTMPITNYTVPLVSRLGNTSTFGKGAGIGVPQPLEPPPNFNPQDDMNFMKKVRFIERATDMRYVRKVKSPESADLPGPRKSILRGRR